MAKKKKSAYAIAADKSSYPDKYDASKGPFRHQELYFEGGYIILALGPEPTLFRVQRALLANQSTVFRDMLESHSAQDQEALEKYFDDRSDETPIFLPDNPEDFACVLKVYYQKLLSPLPDPPDVDFTMRVLHISSRYQLHKAFQWAQGTLRADWTQTSPTWIANCSNPSPPPHLAQDAMKLIAASRNTESTEFLPAAFYLLCVFGNWAGVTPNGPSIAQDDLIIILKGSQCLARAWGRTRAQYGASNDYDFSPSAREAQWWGEFVANSTTITTVLNAMGFTTSPVLPQLAMALNPESLKTMSTDLKEVVVRDAKRHEELYFEGGHVVLALGPIPTLLRVQRAMLVTQSEIFRDMLGIPLPREDGSETSVEGLSDDNPVFLPDDPKEFACAVKVYYQHMLTPLPEKPDFDFVMGVLRIASKYYFHRASEWAFGTLRADWARTSSTWQGHLTNPTPPPDLGQNALKLILASRIAGSTEFLPVAFYFLCVFDNWSNVAPGDPMLSQDDFIILLKGSRCLTKTWGSWRSQRQLEYGYIPEYEAQWWKEFIADNTTITAVLPSMGFA